MQADARSRHLPLRRQARAAAILASAAALLFAASGCGGGDEPPAQAAAEPATTTTTTATETTAAPEASLDPEGKPPLWSSDGFRMAEVRDGEKVVVYAEPGHDEVDTVGAKTEFGSHTVFSVTDRKGRWLEVATPVTGDNSPGWIEADRKLMRFRTTPLSIHADLGDREVTVQDDRKVIDTYAVTIGAAGTGTPTGRFAVTDVIVGGLHPAYGCCALALSAHQTNLAVGWSGGDRIAMHGTVGPVGSASSNGCLRLSDPDADELAGRAIPGTPVFITN
jgi:lipoprotein-anchoring transpeptidase ErfK/SrfK